MMNNNGRPTKKRRANDGQTTTDCAHDMNTVSTIGGGFLSLSSWFGYFSRQRDDTSSRPPSIEHSIQQSLSKMDRMENIMMRMEDKLATVGSLESRCEQLERKCSSLEAILKLTSQSRKEMDDISKTLKYHEMLIRNQKWEYSAPISSENILFIRGFQANEVDYIYQTSYLLKRNTEALRRGDFPDDDVYAPGDKGIRLHVRIDEDLLSYDESVDNEMSRHWKEFAAALKHFKPALDMLPNDCKSFIIFHTVQLNCDNTQCIKEALMSMPFKCFCFGVRHRIFHGGMSTIAALIDSNKYLQQLQFFNIQDMDRSDIAQLSSAIHRHSSIVEVTFQECFSDGLGDYMLHLLSRGDGDLKLERLSMPGNHLRGSQTGFNVCTRLTNFLAANPRLTFLDLQGNYLDDNDVALIANALHSNTTLSHLYIQGNSHIGDDGTTSLQRALYDACSLNSVSDSNHSCSVKADFIMTVNNVALNNSETRDVNRAQKIYSLLSIRNKRISNAQHFGDMDINLLPRLLEVVQKYSRLTGEDEDYVKALSIVYEIMRRWDKVSPLYKPLGTSEGFLIEQT